MSISLWSTLPVSMFLLCISRIFACFFFFFFNDTATTEIYTLSLHDALPISVRRGHQLPRRADGQLPGALQRLVDERATDARSEEHTSELQSPCNLVCRLLLEKKKKKQKKLQPRRLT